MNAIILAMCLIGPAPESRCKLFIASHSGTYQAKRLKADIERDDWIRVNCEVVFEERDVLEPRYKFTKGDAWQKWPKHPDMPHGCFCTSGMCLKVLRPECERWIAEVEQPQEFLTNWQFFHRFGHLEFVPRNDVAPVPEPQDEGKGE